MGQHTSVAPRAAGSAGRLLPQLVVLVWLPVCFFFGLVNRRFLPEKYFLDDRHLQAVMPTATPDSADSFVVMAWIYRALGAMGHPTAVQAVTMLLFFALLFTCAPWSALTRFTVYETGIFCFCAAACAVYLAQYSKESLVLLLVLGLVLLPRSVLGDVVFVAAACLYAATLREYWFLVAGVYVLLRLVLRRARTPVWVPLVMAGALLAFAVGVEVLLGQDLNTFREIVAQYRVNSPNAQSAIQDYLPADTPPLAAANAALTVLLLVVPIPLLLDGSVVYLGFSVVIAALWLGTVARGVAWGTRRGWFARDVPMARAVSLLLAMLTVQAVFEPDYGSYLKHLTPLLPLFPLLFVRFRAQRERDARARGGSPAVTA
ncbi:hypothetical protein SAMN05421810_10620 [Amycolatopsis arida]|uniref:Dolichyl-phosphate-mannose-protein mannosyltransferase n=1 Tax=Amycolatopsis arida TaxID=587909 RepID=A0A1I5XF82_9PSEU|nr:hypothetical protein [Amycolatopsis arida]TDX97497.1 hypothetical protein CLV69_102601 [Amycolatopsis arida]SFQ30476.1 hypothetical protein SAMN05421810_10620 [Amycolatopsis arida]